ncbi:UNVERIFIED_CONTAM: hypothetical protein FKN15_072375 [Acipenser sinensis]
MNGSTRDKALSRSSGSFVVRPCSQNTLQESRVFLCHGSSLIDDLDVTPLLITETESVIFCWESGSCGALALIERK